MYASNSGVRILKSGSFTLALCCTSALQDGSESLPYACVPAAAKVLVKANVSMLPADAWAPPERTANNHDCYELKTLAMSRLGSSGRQLLPAGCSVGRCKSQAGDHKDMTDHTKRTSTLIG